MITLTARLIRLQTQIVGIGSVVNDSRRRTAGDPVNGGAGVRRIHVRARSNGDVVLRAGGRCGSSSRGGAGSSGGSELALGAHRVVIGHDGEEILRAR